MKRLIAVFFAIIILCCFCTGCNDINVDDISYTKNEEIIVCTPDDISKEAVEIFGQDRASLKESMKKSGILLSGAYKDRTCSFTVVRETTDFSRQIKDLNLFSQLELNDISASLVPDYISYHRNQDAVYIYSDGQIDGIEHPYCTRQYVTVKNGDLYIISFTVSDEMLDISDEQKMVSVMNRITIEESDSLTVLYIVLIAVAIIAVTVLVAFIVISIIKDLRNKNN